MMDLKGRNALLTGSTCGLGPHFARALAQEGVNVALVDRPVQHLDQLAGEVRHMGVEAVAIPADIKDPVGREAILSYTRAELGSIDILVNHASVAYAGHLHTWAFNEIDDVIQTNLVASIMLSRGVLPEMLARGEGHLVHSASLVGKIAIPYVAPYVATKHGLVGFNSALQAELKGTGVYSTAICWGNGARVWRDPGELRRTSRALVQAIKHHRIEHMTFPIVDHLLVMLASAAPGFIARLMGYVRYKHVLGGPVVQVDADAK